MLNMSVHKNIFKILFLPVLITICFQAVAQPPIISGLSKRSGALNDSITVLGSNFSSNPSDLVLFFGGIRGNILSSSSNYIKSLVPGNATTGNVTVVNKVNGLQSTSSQIFFNSFSGSGFSTAQLSSEISFPESSELFDISLCDFVDRFHENFL